MAPIPTTSEFAQPHHSQMWVAARVKGFEHVQGLWTRKLISGTMWWCRTSPHTDVSLSDVIFLNLVRRGMINAYILPEFKE